MSEERTKGYLKHLVGTKSDALVIRGPQRTRVATTEKGEHGITNPAHIVRCWNAVEDIGGDPATVAELREVLDATSTMLRAYVIPLAHASTKDEAMLCQRLCHCNWTKLNDDIRATIAKTKGE